MNHTPEYVAECHRNAFGPDPERLALENLLAAAIETHTQIHGKPFSFDDGQHCCKLMGAIRAMQNALPPNR